MNHNSVISRVQIENVFRRHSVDLQSLRGADGFELILDNLNLYEDLYSLFWDDPDFTNEARYKDCSDEYIFNRLSQLGFLSDS